MNEKSDTSETTPFTNNVILHHPSHAYSPKLWICNCYVEENFKFTLKKSPKKVHFYIPVYSTNEHQISKPLPLHVHV